MIRFICFAVIAGVTIANADQPNFVIILADDLGYGDISCYDGWIETPHIDELASSGLRFTDFHSNGAVCSPTRAALLTGRYQQRAGVPGVITAARHRYHGLHGKEITFAKLLKKAEYELAIFGKWHLGYQKKFNPIVHGFDRFRGYVSGNVDYFSHVDQTGIYDWWEGQQHIEEEGYVTRLITKHALQFIDRHRARPFCLYVAHEAPHYPYQGPHDAADRSVGGQFNNHGSRLDKKRAYREMVVELDLSVGEIVNRLRSHGILSKTLVFFTSDNGATRLGSNGPLRGHKGSLWEGGQRVPAIAHWPEKIVHGVTHETAMTMDIPVTIAKLAGARYPDQINPDGADLSELLLHREPLRPRRLFWQHGVHRAVRDGHWKWVDATNEGSAFLFDLRADAAEQHDLAKAYPNRVSSMSAAYTKWYADVMRGATIQPEK